MSDHKKTYNPDEIKKFTDDAKKWWDPEGPFKPLHHMHPTRMEFIAKKIRDYAKDNQKDLKDLAVLDVGCGGGILAESLARLGVQVTAIDVGVENIEIAKIHAKQERLHIDYQPIELRDFNKKNKKKFDIVIASEVIEHVENVPLFVQDLIDSLADRGIVILSTINRTMESYLKAIIGAEYILRWLKVGTHDWNKFITPTEMHALFKKHALRPLSLRGMMYTILNGQWRLGEDVKMNYIVAYQKPAS